MATMGSVMSGAAAAGIATGKDPAAFPFRCELSLAPLITFWTWVLPSQPPHARSLLSWENVTQLPPVKPFANAGAALLSAA